MVKEGNYFDELYLLFKSATLPSQQVMVIPERYVGVGIVSRPPLSVCGDSTAAPESDPHQLCRSVEA